MEKLIIKTPSRIHFGVINIKNPDYNLYGCAGCAIEEPYFLIEVEKSDEFIFENFKRKELINKFLNLYRIKKYKNKIKFKIIKEIKEHIGLGSTTQLCLAFSYSLSYFNKSNFNPYFDSKILGIGKISGIGIGAFIYGGFLIDEGKKNYEEISRISFNHKVPDNWAFIILFNKNQKKGLNEKEEMKVFKELPVTPKDQIEMMKEKIEMMKDSIKEKNIEKFGKSLTELQILVGKNFIAYQKRIFTHEENEKLIKLLLKKGAYGVGQSSWGPVVYGLFEEKNAKKISENLKKEMDKKVEVIFSKSNNIGVKVSKNAIIK